MNAAHLHLLLNHVPVITTLIVVLLLGYALLRRSAELTRAGLALLVFGALSGGATYLTGEPAEHVVEDMPDVWKDGIEEHEEAATVAVILVAGAGVVALAGLLLYRKRADGVPRGFALIAFLAALIAACSLAYTALVGGRIRHSEIRPAGVSMEAAPARAALQCA